MPEYHRPHRILHTMLRVAHPERSLDFYTRLLGMKLLRRRDYEEGRFSLLFLGYGDEYEAAVLELTHNWDQATYEPGDGYGHLALAVDDIEKTCRCIEREGVAILRGPGPMRFDPDEIIAFIEDPDGYQIELVERE